MIVMTSGPNRRERQILLASCSRSWNHKSVSVRFINRFSLPRAFLVFLCLFSITSSLVSAAQEKVVLQLKWKHAFQFAGFYAAVEKGYYEKAGLQVTLVEGHPETNFARELTSGRCHYAVALSSMLIHRNEGDPVVALAAILQHSPEVLLVAGASGINTPHQMAGKTVAVSPEDTPALLAMFKNEGLAADSVKTIPYEFSPEKMVSGAIAGMGAYTINEPFAMQERGIPYRLIQPRDYGVDFYGDCLYTTDQEIRQNPQRVKAFLDASLQGWHYAMAHREEMIDLLKTRYKCPISKEALRYEADEMAKIMFTELIDIGHMNEGRWRHIGDTYVRLGMLPQDYSLEGFLYDRDPKKDYSWLWWTLGGTAASTVLLGIVVLGLMRINARIANAEKQARESKAMLQTVINTIPVGVYWQDKENRIIGCNQVFATYADLDSPEKAQGISTDSLPWAAQTDAAIADVEVVHDGKSVLLEEKKLEMQDGSTRHFYQSKVPLKNDQGETLGLLGVLEDITSLKTAERHQVRLKDRLLQAQKYESLHRLANGVCHHSNNILQALTSYAELARLQSPPGQTRDFMDGVLRESQRVAALNRVLLTCTGHGIHQFDDQWACQYLKEALPTLKCCMPSSHVLEWFHKGPDALVNMDRESLQHLLINLLTNASEATEGAGTVWLESGTARCTAAALNEGHVDPPPPAGEYLYLDVRDAGRGIAGEDIPMVFDPFYSTKFTGRGLGMAAVLGIVKSHMGTIRILSKRGEGTTVRVLLPILRRAEEDYLSGAGG